MKTDLLNTPCPCGLGKFGRNLISWAHEDPPNILRCSFCRIPVERYCYPNIEALKRKKKYAQSTEVH